MKRSLFAVAMLAATPILCAVPAHADQCSGVLSRSQGDLVLTAPRKEGICIVGKADESLVLRDCALGRRCVVVGAVDLCADQGECVQVTHVTKARK